MKLQLKTKHVPSFVEIAELVTEKFGQYVVAMPTTKQINDEYITHIVVFES